MRRPSENSLEIITVFSPVLQAFTTIYVRVQNSKWKLQMFKKKKTPADAHARNVRNDDGDFRTHNNTTYYYILRLRLDEIARSARFIYRFQSSRATGVFHRIQSDFDSHDRTLYSND